MHKTNQQHTSTSNITDPPIKVDSYESKKTDQSAQTHYDYEYSVINRNDTSRYKSKEVKYEKIIFATK